MWSKTSRVYVKKNHIILDIIGLVKFDSFSNSFGINSAEDKEIKMGNEIEPSGVVSVPVIATEAVQTVANIANTGKNINSILTKVTVLSTILAVIIAIIKFHGCMDLNFIPGIKLAPTVIKATDTNKTIIINPSSVIYTPKATKQDPNPIAVIVSKPIEAKVSIKSGEISVQNSGFVFIPKISEVYVLGNKLQTALGARILFTGNFGLEALVNTDRCFIGIDYRDPILNLLTTSMGVSPGWTEFGIRPYIGESITLCL